MRRSSWHLPGKSVLITGAAGGIGAATTQLLATRQTRLSLLDVRYDDLRQIASELDGEVLCHAVDITEQKCNLPTSFAISPQSLADGVKRQRIASKWLTSTHLAGHEWVG